MDLSKRFSLDHLVSGSQSEAPAESTSNSEVGSRAMQEAIRAYVSPVLGILDVSPEKKQRLFTLYDSVHGYLPQSEIDGFRDVVKWMQGMNLVKIVETDAHGNDVIQKS
jgi:hypothetical protein